MKERPILFYGSMVRALLAGTKTQTRRVSGLDVINAEPDRYRYLGMVSGPGEPHFAFHDERTGAQTLVRCRNGQPGDRLWVRETWYCDDYRVQRGPYLKPDDMDVAEAQDDGMLVYRASSGDRPYEAEQPIWRPAIHMPRWASRITLEITAVRVERLQIISEDDLAAEGIQELIDAGVDHDGTPRDTYRVLWEGLNGPGSWEANPWVWAVSFKRVEAS